MSNQHNRDTTAFPTTHTQQLQTSPALNNEQERAQYLRKLHAQATTLRRELSQRLIFLGDYIDHALCLMDSDPGPWDRVINPAQTLLNNILDLVHSAEILAALRLQRGFEDWQKLNSLTLVIEEFVGRTGWMFLGRDFCGIQAWVSEAEKLLGDGKRAVVWVEETIRKVEIQAGVEGVVIAGAA